MGSKRWTMHEQREPCWGVGGQLKKKTLAAGAERQGQLGGEKHVRFT